MKLKIVSRKSNLALQQTSIVKQLLLQKDPGLDIEVIPVSTKGDEILDQSLVKIGGKGLFVKELEQQLLDGTAHLAVHSVKDMPAVLPNGLTLAAILPRADPRDVFVSKEYSDIASLPAGAKVGTSSLRRQAQVLSQRSDVSVTPLRGNVGTRIKKLINDEYDAIILAAAGLERLALEEWLTYPFSIDQMLPAVGQGALGIEINSNNQHLMKILLELHDRETAHCVMAERSMNAKLDGGCQAPIAGYAEIVDSKIKLRGLVAAPDGQTILYAEHSDVFDNAEQIGLAVAAQLLEQGAGQIIKDAKSLWD